MDPVTPERILSLYADMPRIGQMTASTGPVHPSFCRPVFADSSPDKVVIATAVALRDDIGLEFIGYVSQNLLKRHLFIADATANTCGYKLRWRHCDRTVIAHFRREEVRS